MHESNRVGLLAVTLSTVFILSACVETQTVDTDTETPINVPGAAASPDATSDGNLPDETSVDTPPQQCTTNPMASDFAPFVEQGVVPTGLLGTAGPGGIIPTSDVFYHFQIGENGYNSCAELSYLVLNGSNGDAQQSAGIGAAIADAVVLFHNGDMIDSPAPFQMKLVEDVTRISDHQIEVLYGHAGRSTAEGVTEHHTFNFVYTDGGLTGEGSLPEDIDGHVRLNLK
ncbi:hypothetical protein CFAEC_02175 [Corynebacterium faecale]|uniref:LppP/LprE family lipoprotein n=1 Tax=Corynebacterium faecale TaxID=1758466 RepID=UPI0025B2EAEC|nr:LppP/LprE family lipoprotein [Corynebacterium faecale]WJY91290.1 hypothetical protein CFAEC_02175 [Corynebacterium faecale]